MSKLEEIEEEKLELLRPKCPMCKSPMLPRAGFYRCYNCGNKRDFTEKEQSFWEEKEGRRKKREETN